MGKTNGDYSTLAIMHHSVVVSYILVNDFHLGNTAGNIGSTMSLSKPVGSSSFIQY